METNRGIADLEASVGQEAGPTDWFVMDQSRIDTFADATEDHQWIHVDPERARSGPFGGPIAHGYLTLSLIPHLLGRTFQVDGVRMGVNYGLNRLRFPSPVPVPGTVRATFTLNGVKDIQGGSQVLIGFEVRVEAQEKPSAVGEAVYNYYT
jgi:acyl dehydratase